MIDASRRMVIINLFKRLRDEAGQPLMLASLSHRGVALLFRPDSLMSDAQALTALRCALVFAATDPAMPTPGPVATAR